MAKRLTAQGQLLFYAYLRSVLPDSRYPYAFRLSCPTFQLALFSGTLLVGVALGVAFHLP